MTFGYLYGEVGVVDYIPVVVEGETSGGQVHASVGGVGIAWDNRIIGEFLELYYHIALLSNLWHILSALSKVGGLPPPNNALSHRGASSFHGVRHSFFASRDFIVC